MGAASAGFSDSLLEVAPTTAQSRPSSAGSLRRQASRCT